MKIEAKISRTKAKKDKLVWSASAPLLGIFTQGKSKKDAALMLKDAIEIIHNYSFSVSFEWITKEDLYISSTQMEMWLAFILERIRETEKITLQETAAKLFSNSPTAYARYERGESVPSIIKFISLIQAVSPKVSLVLRSK